VLGWHLLPSEYFKLKIKTLNTNKIMQVTSQQYSRYLAIRNTSHRLVINAPYQNKNVISYGLIVYAEDTQKWLLVQRRHSIEYIALIRGMYRLTHLPIFFDKMTREEIRTVQTYFTSNEKFKELYNSMYLEDTYLDYALLRREENAELILNLVNQPRPGKELDWNWPRGRINYNRLLERERPFMCALREFAEEVEVELPQAIRVSPNYISELIHSYIGRNIECRYWLYIIPHEFELPSISENLEVSDRKWMSTAEATQNLTNHELFIHIQSLL
jgi:8-oxo-dGTP pyrophosphatase MutT (NUDIX family)